MPQFFIIAITCYLVSLVATLTGSFFIKLIPPKIILILTGLHFLLLVIWLLKFISGGDSDMTGKADYVFLAFFCLGIMVAGLILRSGFNAALKIYFTIFLLSVPVFIVAPSRLLGFIATGNLNTVNPKRFHLSENYYLVEQGRSLSGEDTVFYKLVREMGLFHATLNRNVALPASVDSVINLSSMDRSPVELRYYFQQHANTDSSDIQITTEKFPDKNEVKQIRNPK